MRIGAAVTFTSVVLDYRNSTWKFQPPTELTAANADAVQPATFADTRTAAPRGRGRRHRMATFNVLNYFPTTGDSLAGCTYYTDRAGTPITVKRRLRRSAARRPGELRTAAGQDRGRDQRLAQTSVSLRRSRTRPASARTATTPWASWSPRSTPRRAALGLVPSPAARPRADQDVIRTAFIYKTAAVETVGASRIQTIRAFGNAREPIAQVFTPVGATVACSSDRQPLQVQGIGRSMAGGRRHRRRPGRVQRVKGAAGNGAAGLGGGRERPRDRGRAGR